MSTNPNRPNTQPSHPPRQMATTPAATRIMEMQVQLGAKLDLLLSPTTPDGKPTAMDLQLDTQKLTLQAINQLRTEIGELMAFFRSPTTEARLREILNGRRAK